MNENAVKIQIVMNTLGEMNVPATQGNAERLSVIWQLLTQARDDLSAPQETQTGAEGEESHGAAEAE